MIINLNGKLNSNNIALLSEKEYTYTVVSLIQLTANQNSCMLLLFQYQHAFKLEYTNLISTVFFPTIYRENINVSGDNDG